VDSNLRSKTDTVDTPSALQQVERTRQQHTYSCRCRITVTLARWAGPAGKLAPRIGSSNGSGCRSRREKVAVVEVSFGSVVAGSLEDRLGRCFSRYSEASFDGLVAAANSLLSPSSFAMAVAAAVVVSKRYSVEVTATALLGVEDPEISALGSTAAWSVDVSGRPRMRGGTLTVLRLLRAR
jgi:hypothetical protein